jgi:hypothetical protein
MLGRASYSVGADAYLGAREASALIGRWGSGVQDVRRGHRHHHHRGRADQGGETWGEEEERREHHETPRELRREEWERMHPGESWEERERRRHEWERRQPGVPFVGMEALMGAIEAQAAKAGIFGIAPRAALVEQRPPNMVNREPLPMSTGTASVGIGLTAQITSRPQRVGFKPERLFVSNFSLDGLGATAWTINDITIGNVSQLAQAGNLPGDMFANVAIDSFVTFKTAQTAMDIVLITTYNGTTDGGIPFTGAIIGLSAQG